VRAFLTQDQYYLYRLIWNRFLASQMMPALFDDTTVDVTAADYLFRAKGSVPKFAGWLAAYGQGGNAEAEENERTEQSAKKTPEQTAAEAEEGAQDDVLPVLKEGETLTLSELKPEQKFTQPPARFNEGSLVKALEENGIGRPSTYASIISVLQARDYVIKNEGKFRPTILGRRRVVKILHPVFDDILDVEYTARMEDQLDEIEKGKADYKETLEAFYKTFKKDLKRAAKEMPNFKEGQPTGQTCDKCGQGEMVEKAGKFGIFLACNRYPDCDNTKELEPAAPETEELDETCENCGKPMVVKRGRFGMFLACTGYPECKTTRKIITTKQGVSAAKPDQILDELCANYPKCEFTLWNRPVLEPCPKCGREFLTEKITKRHGRQLLCSNETCDYV